jgi:hypothetical protein
LSRSDGDFGPAAEDGRPRGMGGAARTAVTTPVAETGRAQRAR